MDKNDLRNFERETAITWDESVKAATVETFNPRLERKLKRLLEDYPDDVRITVSRPRWADTYEVPKRWIKIQPPRKMTDEQRAALSERGRKAFQKRPPTRLEGSRIDPE